MFTFINGFFSRVSLAMNEHTYCNLIFFISALLKRQSKFQFEKKCSTCMVNLMKFFSADFGYRPYFGNDKASSKSFNASFVSYHKNEKMCTILLLNSFFHR